MSVPVLWAAIIFLVAMMTRLLFIGAPLSSDDMLYFDMASRLSIDVFDQQTIQWAFRTGLIVPLAILQKIFGYNLWSYYLLSVGASIGAVMLVYLIMLKIADQRAAVISSLLFASSGFGLFHATQILTDTPNLCALLLTFYVFLHVESNTGKRNILLLLLAAACGFYAHLIRMPNAVFLAALPVYEYLTYRSLRRTVLFSAFFTCFVLLECSFYLIATGNPLKRILLIRDGVVTWIQYQNELSWSAYLFGPFQNILKWTTGLILLSAAIPGSIVLIRQRNYRLAGLCVGGLLLFLTYSYSVTSLDPLVRALPLQPRYIVAFTCVLAMVAGNLLAHLRVVPLFRTKLPPITIPGLTAAIFALQCQELPQLPSTAFFTDDTYFVGDRLVRDYVRKHPISEPVHAFPGAMFRMFDGYSKLNLIDHHPATPPKPGRHYLVHKSRLVQSIRSARVRRHHQFVKNGDLLGNRDPTHEILVETNSIALFYIRPHSIVPVVDIAKHPDIWHTGTGAKKDTGTAFAVDNLGSKTAVYLSMFKDPFHQPTPAQHSVYLTLKPQTDYRVEVQYRLKKPFRSVRFFMREYDKKRSLQMVDQYMPSGNGQQTFSTGISTSAQYQSFRIFIRLGNTNDDNHFHLESLVISELR